MINEIKNILFLDSQYFSKIIEKLSRNHKRKNIGIVVVAHILPDALPFLDALDSLFYVECVFAKRKSINTNIYTKLKKRFNLLTAERKSIDQVGYVLKHLNTQRDGYIFIDIGGYFSNVLPELQMVLGDKLIGCIEDTENGLLKHLKNTPLSYPFYQVARSPLKQNEDYLVGQAISFSAEAIFREQGIIFNGKSVGVIGYGKIGHGVSNTLRARQALVSVFDIDSVRMTHAYSHGFIPKTKESLLTTSDIVCLAAGVKAMSLRDYRSLKNGAYIFSVTSSDDSLDLSILHQEYANEKISKLITKFTRGKNHFYLLNQGNAINFIHGTTVSHFILLVQAEIIACAIALSKTQLGDAQYSLSSETRQKIAQMWLYFYAK